jgi:hypothetical protein
MPEMAMGGGEPEVGSPEDIAALMEYMAATENPAEYNVPQGLPQLAYGMEDMRPLAMPEIRALPQLAAYQQAQPITPQQKATQPLSPEATGEKAKPVKTAPTYEDTALPGTLETLRALSNIARSEPLGPWMGPRGGYGLQEPLLDKALRDIALQRGNDFAVPEGYNPGAGARPPGVVDYLKGAFSRQTPPAPEIAGQGYEFVPQMPNDMTRPGEAKLVQYGTPQKDVNTRGKEGPGSANPADKNFTGNLPRNYRDEFANIQNTLDDVAFGRGQYKGNIYTGPPKGDRTGFRGQEDVQFPFSGTNEGYYPQQGEALNLPFAIPSPQQKIQDILTPAPMRTPIEGPGGIQGLLNMQGQDEQRRREEEERRRRELEMQMQQQQGGLGGLFGGFGGGSTGGGGGSLESLLGGWTL